jgi:hypothetical protein
MLTLVLCALAHSCETLAADGAALGEPLPAEKPGLPTLPTSVLAIAATPFALNPQTVAAPVEDFSASEFRPRKRNTAAAGLTNYGSGDPMFRTTTVWQRLNEFRAQDRVRVLTLWEMGGSNVSLQAGRKGDPSLQWSSSWTNRSKVSSGLLDRFLAASLSGLANRGNSLHYAPATANPPKPQITTAVPAGK